MFSTEFPGTGIYMVKEDSKHVDLIKNSYEKTTRKIPARDGTADYILETIRPIVHIPLTFPIDGKWKFSLVLGGYSPGYDLFWILAPVIGEDSLSASGGFMLNIGKFDIVAYKVLDKLGASVNLEIFRKRLDSDFIILANLYGKYSESYEIGTSMRFVKGSYFGGFNLGLSESSPVISATYGMGFENAKTYLEYDYPRSFKISVDFSIFETDIGILDPYFHISHMFSEISLGYDENPYIDIYLGIEEGDFLNYMRNFPKIGIRLSQSGWNVLFDFGM